MGQKASKSARGKKAATGPGPIKDLPLTGERARSPKKGAVGRIAADLVTGGITNMPNYTRYSFVKESGPTFVKTG
jgi:hypothetical protein